MVFRFFYNGSCTLQFSSGAYVAIISPLLKDWELIFEQNMAIKNDETDGMNMYIKSIESKKDIHLNIRKGSIVKVDVDNDSYFI